MVLNASKASLAERVIRPMESTLGSKGNAPSTGQRPAVVFKPKTPLKAAGTRTEPPESEPMANAHRPAAMATPDPELEPPGARWFSMSLGFHGVPRGPE